MIEFKDIEEELMAALKDKTPDDKKYYMSDSFYFLPGFIDWDGTVRTGRHIPITMIIDQEPPHEIRFFCTKLLIPRLSDADKKSNIIDWFKYKFRKKR